MLDEWRKNKRSKVWISDTLMTDLNVPLCIENSDLPRVVQAFFLGEGLPAFILTLYSKAASTGEQKEEVHKVTVSAIKLLRWSLLDFCHCKFVILPLTLDIETLSVASLDEELKLRKRRCRQYYDGDLFLKTMTYETLVSAAIALQGTSALPYTLEMPMPVVRPPLLQTGSVLMNACVHSYGVIVSFCSYIKDLFN